MTPRFQKFNALNTDEAIEGLLRCCGSKRWAERMLAERPFHSEDELIAKAELTWKTLSRKDWLEAFSCHPKIGNISTLREKFTNTKRWAMSEQSGVESASDDVLRNLAEANGTYEQKFSFIFIVCATGKTAKEMLHLMMIRLNNDPETEINIAAEEQHKITRIRLEKLLSSLEETA